MCSLRRLFIRAEVWQVVGATRRQLPRDHPDERPQECPHHTLGRAVMVRRVLQDGWTVAAAAAAFEVSVRTVREWLARFRHIGHRITGDRRGQNSKVGWEFVHVAVDDASGLAYVEILPDEKRQSVTGFLVRALRYFKGCGIAVERVMSDNGSGYVSRLFRKVCRLRRLRQIRTRPYTPKPNGRAARFTQPLLREWAYALPYRSSDRRA